MNYVFIDSNKTIGGIEALFIELAKYLSKKNNIYFIVHNNNSAYIKNLENIPSIKFVVRTVYKRVEYFSDNDIKIEKQSMLENFDNCEDYHVIVPYFDALQFAIAVFGDRNNFKLMHLWAHPQSWCTTLKLKNSDWFTKERIINSKYMYQKKLLEALRDNGGDFYSSRSVTVFNSWYYDIDINPQKVESLPIDSYNQIESWQYDNNKNSLSVLWVGRFDAWKNEAIIHIYRTLELLAEKNKGVKIKFDIVGYGKPQHDAYIRNNVFSKDVEVNFIGGVRLEELPKLFTKYDLGVAMGLTVKKMAQVGLPSIIIDSFERGQAYIKNANWLFDTSEGDAGDGYYFNIAGHELKQRKKLIELLEEVTINPCLLSQYSIRCKEFVDEHYSFERQSKAIIQTAVNSTFAGLNLPIYRRNFVIRIAYLGYKKIQSIKSLFLRKMLMKAK